MVPGGAAVLRVLLVLRVEVVDRVRHDVPAKYTQEYSTYMQGCGSGSAWIRISLSCWIRIWIQEGKNDLQI